MACGPRNTRGVMTISSVAKFFCVSLLVRSFSPGISLTPGVPLMARLSVWSSSLTTTTDSPLRSVTTPV